MYQCQFGCGILKILGPKMQAFCPRIDMLKGNHCILRIPGAPVHQKMGMILENKVVQKLKLEKEEGFLTASLGSSGLRNSYCVLPVFWEYGERQFVKKWA